MNSNLLNKPPHIALFLFFVSFILFLSTMCPSIYWRDAAEFQVVAYQLGIAHPAGSPFYALIAKIFTFLPFGNIAFKVNLVSAFFGALLIALTFLLATECLELIFPAPPKGLLFLSGAIAASFYAVSQSLWENAIVAEVYTLQNCFVVLIALFLLKGLRQPHNKSFLYLTAFLFGLSTGAHIIMILYIPALLLFLWLFYRKSIFLSQMGIMVALVILGASIYLYLPIRSSVDPYYDWGNPETAKNFITHVTDRKDAKRHFSFSPEGFTQKLKKYGQYYREDFHYLGIILGLIGAGVCLQNNPRLFLGLGAFFFSQWFFFIRYWPWASAFIPTFLLFTVGIAAGILSIVRKSLNIASKSPVMGIQRHFFPGVLVALCIIQIVFWGCSHWKKNNRSNYWSPYEFYKYLYEQIEFEGVLVNTLYYFGTSYLHQCENYRLDITNLFLSEILSPQLFNTVIPERYPLLTIPQQEGPKIGETIINANIMDHPFYWDPTSKNNRLVKGNLQPNGLLFRITPTPLPVSPEAINLHTGKIETFFKHYTPVFSLYNDPEENLLYSLILESISRFFYDQQKYRLLIAHLMVADRLTPDTVSILNGLASAYANLCQFAEAEQYLHKSLLINPHHITTLENLGQLYLDTEQYHQAFSCYRRILKDDPENQTAYFGMGRYYEQMRNVEKAREYYGKVIRLNPESPLGEKAREIVSSISPHAKKEKP